MRSEPAATDKEKDLGLSMNRKIKVSARYAAAVRKKRFIPSFESLGTGTEKELLM